MNNKNHDPERGWRIQKARDQLGITQSELAKRVIVRGESVSRVTVSRWENGHPIEAAYLKALSRALGPSEDYIVHGPKGRSLAPETIRDISVATATLIRIIQERRIHLPPEQMERLLTAVTRAAADNGALSEATIREIINLRLD